MKRVVASGQSVYPSKIICVGRNYLAHIKELHNDVPDEMVLFVKPNSSISENLSIVEGEEIHYECELCFLVKEGKLSHLGLGLDLTKRKLQQTLKEKGLPWERAKAFDGSALFSEFITLDDPLEHLSFEFKINDRRVQFGEPKAMIHTPQAILEEVSSFMTLVNGDIVMTGTPKGVGKIHPLSTYTANLFSGDKLCLSQSWVLT